MVSQLSKVQIIDKTNHLILVLDNISVIVGRDMTTINKLIVLSI